MSTATIKKELAVRFPGQSFKRRSKIKISDDIDGRIFSNDADEEQFIFVTETKSGKITIYDVFDDGFNYIANFYSKINNILNKEYEKDKSQDLAKLAMTILQRNEEEYLIAAYLEILQRGFDETPALTLKEIRNHLDLKKTEIDSYDDPDDGSYEGHIFLKEYTSELLCDACFRLFVGLRNGEIYMEFITD